MYIKNAVLSIAEDLTLRGKARKRESLKTFRDSSSARKGACPAEGKRLSLSLSLLLPTEFWLDTAALHGLEQQQQHWEHWQPVLSGVSQVFSFCRISEGSEGLSGERE